MLTVYESHCPSFATSCDYILMACHRVHCKSWYCQWVYHHYDRTPLICLYLHWGARFNCGQAFNHQTVWSSEPPSHVQKVTVTQIAHQPLSVSKKNISHVQYQWSKVTEAIRHTNADNQMVHNIIKYDLYVQDSSSVFRSRSVHLTINTEIPKQ